MSMTQRIAALLIVLALSGCASISKTMESWMGHHQSDLTECVNENETPVWFN